MKSNIMLLDYVGVTEINGSLIVIDDVENASFEEVVEIRLADGSMRQGRIVEMDGKRAVIQVFEGTRGIALDNTRTRLTATLWSWRFPRKSSGVYLTAPDALSTAWGYLPRKAGQHNGTPINPVARITPKLH